MTLSEFEKQRQANIERNKELLSSLKINALSNDIAQGITKVQTEEEKKATRPRANAAKPRTPRVKKEKKADAPPAPRRKSRRLAGEKAASTNDKDLESAERKMGKSDNGNKGEIDEDLEITGTLTLKELLKNETEDSLMKILIKSESKISAGDYYDIIVKNPCIEVSKDVQQLREEFSKFKIYDQWHPKDLKITPDRVQVITFHPSAQHKLILAGDTMGHLGIFNAENKQDIDIINYKIHSRNISHIEFNYNDLSKVYTGSSDSVVRSTDLNRGKSDVFCIETTSEGITDLKIQGNDLLFSTKNGVFVKIDMRAPTSSNVALRLANQKIGGFAVNPLDSNLIATGSLDRTLKLWDLRYLQDCDWSKYNDGFQTAGNYAVYDSKLSVSYVDWNRSNDLVCNGYDNTVRLFHLNSNQEFSKGYSGIETDPIVMAPDNTIQHNCKTGRWVSILKTRWQRCGKDGTEKFSVGNMSKFIDIYDNHGNQLAHLGDIDMTNVPAACNLHPTENWAVGAGASSKVYLYY
ncbi:hypothetical protein WICPIJ_004697 [Wickerhamomyces pijperi]|uniref:DNA damage-binding protein CMR1 n=1 Tax=Wickerhamomyces pijperi TaxID=599730 RepID=A0A9P8Q4W6_WICPI|nr:hypothetical protein WICPIJ_004697 [Wickerhamomyces pijperi]